MASFIAGYIVEGLKIEKNYSITDLDVDLRRIYRLAGIQEKGISFLFTDNDVKEEIFLERLNNLLTMGEIPSLYNREDRDEILGKIRPLFKKKMRRGESDTADAQWAFFLQNAKNNLHILLCFSPVGEKFRNRARKFPGLISGCTIDWFLPWTKAALE